MKINKNRQHVVVKIAHVQAHNKGQHEVVKNRKRTSNMHDEAMRPSNFYLDIKLVYARMEIFEYFLVEPGHRGALRRGAGGRVQLVHALLGEGDGLVRPRIGHGVAVRGDAKKQMVQQCMHVRDGLTKKVFGHQIAVVNHKRGPLVGVHEVAPGLLEEEHVAGLRRVHVRLQALSVRSLLRHEDRSRGSRTETLIRKVGLGRDCT